MPIIKAAFRLIALTLFAVSANSHAQLFGDKTKSLLPEHKAFQVSATIDSADSSKINITWEIADDYYLYRDEFKVLSAKPEIQLGETTYPKGVIEDDPEFGKVEVYFYDAELSTKLLAKPSNKHSLNLILHAQGCNKPVGVCYPPMVRELSVELAPQAIATQANSDSKVSSDNNEVKPEKSFLSYLLAAFGAGILLSFTPCVLPMIPILAGVIAGQNKLTKMQSGWLAICYVLGTIVTYMIAGAVAGATGSQLQAYFQTPLFVGVVCILLLILALSLFGIFKIQLPTSLQSKLQTSSVSSKSASITSFGLGLISALVVGACVSPVLILVLGAAITQGDPILGAGIMGSMAFGMGLLLVLFGFGAGWLLPKTGAWMTQIQVLFGFMVLGVIIYLLSVFDYLPILGLWAALLISLGFYLWHISKSSQNPILNGAFKMLAVFSLVWGVMAVVGQATGAKDILKPLENLSSTQTATSINKSVSPLQTTTTLSEVQKLLAQAKNSNQPVIIDFYADWCKDCKRMHKTTFKNKEVLAALKGWQLIEIDVTNTSPDSETAKSHFNVFGPPATLFFNAAGTEQTKLRQYGYIPANTFLDLIQQTTQ